MLVFTAWPDFQVGDVITQYTHTCSDAAVHEQLIEGWSPRWQQLHEVRPEHWTRIIRFIQRFMPSFEFVLPDIAPAQLIRTVKRSKPTAARGPDGYAKQDLLNMSPSHIAWLSLTMSIGHGSCYKV